MRVGAMTVGLLLVAGVHSAGPASGQTDDVLTLRRVGSAGTTALLDVSVPRSLAGATLPGDAFAVGDGTNWTVVASHRLLVDGARLAVVVQGPLDPATLAGTQGALVELIGDLDPTISLVIAANGVVTDVGIDRNAALAAVKDLGSFSAPAGAPPDEMFKKVLLTAVGPVATLVVTTATSPMVGTGIGATDVVDGPVFVAHVGDSRSEGGWLDALSVRTGGDEVVVPTVAQLPPTLHDFLGSVRRRYEIRLPIPASGLSAQLRVSALGTVSSVPVSFLGGSAPTGAPVPPTSVPVAAPAPVVPDATAPTTVDPNALAPATLVPGAADVPSTPAPATTTTTAPSRSRSAAHLPLGLRRAAAGDVDGAMGWWGVVGVVIALGAIAGLVALVLRGRREDLGPSTTAGAGFAPPPAPSAPIVMPIVMADEPEPILGPDRPRVAASGPASPDPVTSTAIDAALAEAQAAIAALARRRAAPGVRVPARLFNAMEAAASAWLDDPGVELADFVGFLTRRPFRSTSLDHIASAEAYLLAAMASTTATTGEAPQSLVDTALEAASLGHSSTPAGRGALVGRCMLAAWPCRHTDLDSVAIVLSPSLTPVDDRFDLGSAPVGIQVPTLLRAVADGARRMLEAERALVALRGEYLAEVGADPRAERAIDAALRTIVVRRSPAEEGNGADLGDDDLAALVAMGWLIPLDRGGDEDTRWWIAKQAFERVTAAFADASIDRLAPMEGLSNGAVGPPASYLPLPQKEPHHVH